MKVAFIGHRKISDVQAVKIKLQELIKNLILNEKVDIFLFGSKSDFDDLCYEVVTEFKQLYTHIRRVYIRAAFELIDESYNQYILSLYEETIFPAKAHGAGAKSYIMRNEAMIDMCEKVVVYFDNNYSLKKSQSGTKIAVDYAKRKGKPIINVFNL